MEPRFHLNYPGFKFHEFLGFFRFGSNPGSITNFEQNKFVGYARGNITSIYKNAAGILQKDVAVIQILKILVIYLCVKTNILLKSCAFQKCQRYLSLKSHEIFVEKYMIRMCSA